MVKLKILVILAMNDSGKEIGMLKSVNTETELN